MARREIVVMGGSAGAIESVSEIVRHLPADFGAAIFVVIHFPGSVTSALPRILSRVGLLPARHAQNEEPIRPGRIYVAPPDCHLFLEDGNVRLTRGPKENGHRPAIDPLFRSAAHHYGSQVVGVLLSGNLNDGTAGLLIIKQHGGLAVVQSPESALHSGMTSQRDRPHEGRSYRACRGDAGAVESADRAGRPADGGPRHGTARQSGRQSR